MFLNKAKIAKKTVSFNLNFKSFRYKTKNSIESYYSNGKLKSNLIEITLKFLARDLISNMLGNFTNNFCSDAIAWENSHMKKYD